MDNDDDNSTIQDSYKKSELDQQALLTSTEDMHQ